MIYFTINRLITPSLLGASFSIQRTAYQLPNTKLNEKKRKEKGKEQQMGCFVVLEDDAQ